MPSPQPSESTQVWFKSSYSGANTTECVECAYSATAAFVRDSKRLEGPVLTLKATAWRDFVDSVSISQLTPPSSGL
ncbi:DUF397 domain-containing protein [Streptomyces flavochromogenes]|uniref:DUF397 domain-containing protein n=1 Tax=Streptomyces flavochromogenes TaxID=68199 RepID=A0ABW6XJV0_9ACTN